MTKADLAEKIRVTTSLTKHDSLEMVEAVLEIVKNTLGSGESLTISGFGSFIVKQKGNRRGRNPQTGEAITIKARRVLTFKPSAQLRRTINS